MAHDTFTRADVKQARQETEAAQGILKFPGGDGQRIRHGGVVAGGSTDGRVRLEVCPGRMQVCKSGQVTTVSRMGVS